jgi:phage terminase large subunit-like protein
LATLYALGDDRVVRPYIRHHVRPLATRKDFERWVVESQPWQYYARSDQREPEGDNWQIWLYQAGRGSGKTRAGSEWAFRQATHNPNWQVGVMSPTVDDLKRVTFDGPSGIMRLVERHRGLIRRVVTAPWMVEFTNGSKILSYTGEAYERLRGPGHHAFLLDEAAGMARLADKSYEQIMFGLRMGERPRLMITSTPKTIPLFTRLNERFASGDPAVVITRATTMDNAANLSPMAIAELRASYDGTRLGRQELYGELLLDVEGSLFPHGVIQQASMPDRFSRVVVAVDPSGAADANSTSDEIGVVVAGIVNGRTRGEDIYYILEDKSLVDSPQKWAKTVATAYEDWKADKVVAEINFGGAMVEATIKSADANLPVKVITASRGKHVRAEPVAALYEQGRVFHCGRFAKMEDQLHHMTVSGYVGEGSPDRADALVYAITELGGGLLPPIVAPGVAPQSSYWLPR